MSQPMPPAPAGPRRVALVVIDSLGIGALPDAAAFGDAGADTFGHIAEACAHGEADNDRRGPLSIPNLARLGLVHASALVRGAAPPGFGPLAEPAGAWGAARERSTGKDTISGHWEMAGQPVLHEWGYFRHREDSVPGTLLDELARRTGVPGFLGNSHASGTQIIEDLGERHLRTLRPIVYTSADSVLQICAHEEKFGLERLYRVCEVARELVDEYRIGRVIARPFTGTNAADFRRTPHRRDYAVPPPDGTLLDAVLAGGGEVVGVGKVPDIFAQHGISRAIKAHGVPALLAATGTALAAGGDRTLVFTNLVDFDQEHGHRRNVAGYALELENFDALLPGFLASLGPGDLAVFTADHGNDPTWRGTDHTREHVPVLVAGQAIAPQCIGIRDSFADLGQSIAAWLGVSALPHGAAFLPPRQPG
jgi:phosphopentomutase